MELIFDLLGFFKILSLALFCFLAFLSSDQKVWSAAAASLCCDAVEAQGADVWWLCPGIIQCVSAGLMLDSISDLFFVIP